MLGYGAISSQSNSRGTDEAQSTDPPKNAPASVVAYALTDHPTVGGLHYTITSVAKESTMLDDGTVPDGEFIIVKIGISNVGNEPATISGSDFHLKSGEATTYEAASHSIQYGGFFLESINPGVSHSGVVLFDVPKNTPLIKYRLLVYGNGRTGDVDPKSLEFQL
jgi:hypothetical protein